MTGVQVQAPVPGLFRSAAGFVVTSEGELVLESQVLGYIETASDDLRAVGSPRPGFVEVHVASGEAVRMGQVIATIY